jgi:PAT family beta-lactamase induction signal transducer AmpG
MVNLLRKRLGFLAGGIATAAGYGPYFVTPVISIVSAVLLFMYLWPYCRSAERAAASDARSEWRPFSG